MSSDDKMRILDDKFLEAESVKNQITAECQQLGQTFDAMMRQLSSQSGDELKGVLEKLKAFLDSGITTMTTIRNELRTIAGECVKIQSDLQSI